MDFYRIKERLIKGKKDQTDTLEIYPDFIVKRSKDLMIRAKSFYAIWDEERSCWSRDEYDVQQLVDQDLNAYKMEKERGFSGAIKVRYLSDFSSKSWIEYRKYLSNMSDNSHELDENLIFSDQVVTKEDYASKKLGYPLKEGSHDAWDELVSTLYSEEERAKIEWAIGSIIAGESKYIQKFVVLYGAAGTGKSTILNIIQKLFEGYYVTFEAKALGSSNNAFSTEVFKTNPLVAIQHDGDLSRIEDNTKLNSIISHEEMLINEKYKPSYTSRINCFLFMGTNRPVKITDAKSGIIRRLIDVKPSGVKLEPSRYNELMRLIDFELGAIASHCLKVYREMGINYYDSYRPFDMIYQTDVFFNFVESSYLIFAKEDGVNLKRAYDMYKTYCDESLVDFKLPRHKFREELKNYFKDFYDITRVNGKQIRSWYSGFLKEKFVNSFGYLESSPSPTSKMFEDFKEQPSIFDEICSSCPAQYATSKTEVPLKPWDDVTTILSEIDTSKLHYVKIPDNMIVIDFDLKDEDGNKSYDLNVEAASKWPSTYAEVSKGGQGIHLHYIYEGDPSKLSRLYSEDIEVKTFTGKSSLRRKLTRCNALSISRISSGLPKKEEKMVNFNSIKSEKGLRNLIIRNLKKEIHPGTKPSVDFIYKILEDAYDQGLHYDVTDMRPDVMAFANNSTNHPEYCLKLVNDMKFKSEEPSDDEEFEEDRIVFFDVEVFPNLFLVNWKYAGDGKECVRMINPTPGDIERLMKFKLVGYNCRRYDNHILYGCYIGYNNEQLYNLSQRIINNSPNCMFAEAYNLSYTDVYDFASAANKMSLKKWEIKLGIHHQELGLPWDEPVPEDQWELVAKYCDNDVISTEEVFNHLKGDWVARQILSQLSGLSVNATTNQHSTKIIFEGNKHPQDQFVYTDLSTIFPGYKFDNGKSYYKGVCVGEGGYVYAKEGMHVNVDVEDVASMHPSSIIALNLFGDHYTKRFKDIVDARVAIKHSSKEMLEDILDGQLIPFYEKAQSGEFSLKDLSNALKTVINSVYGLTAASFDNPFKDPRNKDNIVAKRGALFMVDLKEAVEDFGYEVVHIKTDSIKIPNADEKVINFIREFGSKYGYTFETEEIFSKMCLVNDAVYIAKNKDDGIWEATGAQFAHPYVFKKLFSKDPIDFRDRCETKAVSTALYLDMNEGYPDVSAEEKELSDRSYNKGQEDDKKKRKLNPIFEKMTDEELENVIATGHNYQFVGKVGSFCPILPGSGGGILVREKDGKYYAATGTKGFRWMESEMVEELGKQDVIDDSYFKKLCDDAVANISQYGDFEWFVSED